MSQDWTQAISAPICAECGEHVSGRRCLRDGLAYHPECIPTAEGGA